MTDKDSCIKIHPTINGSQKKFKDPPYKPPIRRGGELVEHNQAQREKTKDLSAVEQRYQSVTNLTKGGLSK